MLYKLAYILFFVACFTSCNVAKKIDKLNKKDPLTVAKKTRQLYPCDTQTVKTDTLVSVKDSVVYEYVKGADSLVYIPGEVVTIDSFINKHYPVVKTVYKTIEKIIIKYKHIKDSAADTIISKQEQVISAQNSRIKKQRKSIWLLITLLAISVAINLKGVKIPFINLFKTKKNE